ncbi:hypothetical protein CGRA01v4_14779 [Colletotrichum graminicola]|nr:hypothetical protein CGRA01v4_14779 [Colletotrichum graminicola]
MRRRPGSTVQAADERLAKRLETQGARCLEPRESGAQVGRASHGSFDTGPGLDLERLPCLQWKLAKAS